MECKNLRNVTIGDGISTISEYAFWNCNKIEKIILGKNIKKIEDNAFYGITGAIEIYCKATTPPQIRVEANFRDEYYTINKESSKLYIPKGTYSAYYLSNWGSIFDNIIEMEE